MRKNILSAVVLTAVMAMGSAGFAAGMQATGTIKAIDAATMTVTMEDGVVYTLPAGFKIDSLKAGEKVTVTWEMKGDLKAIDTLQPA